ncbi:MAG: murein transglycosylase, partial [Microcoleus sp. SIO2G3]|nr:murein transglycosylase [Microcoleus sp. SIO2G3]
MLKRFALFTLSLFAVLLLTNLPLSARSQASPVLQLATPAIAPDEQLAQQANYQALTQAIEHSLAYLNTAEAQADYQQLAIPGITRDRVERSLVRFRQLLQTNRSRNAPGTISPTDLQAAVDREFVFYQSIGRDGQGTVDFTGYFEPVFAASRTRTTEYRYPIYREPPDLASWPQPHPTRIQLEGADGLQGSQGRLRGLELVWLRDRLDAFLIQVQGSARLQLTDGSTMTFGYAGHTDYPYTGIGRELVRDGKLAAEGLTLPNVIAYFRQHPEDLSLYLPRNDRFVFFRSTQGAPATGSLGVPVTAERSIATDRSLMPPGALALIQTQIPNSQLELQSVSRYVLDQDTGGAIRGAGRV